MSAADVQIKNQRKEGEDKIKKTNVSTNPISGKIIAIVLTVAILIIGTFFYFIASGNSSGAVVSNSGEMNSNVPQEQMKTNDNSNTIGSNLEEPMNGKGSSEEETQNSNSLFNHILQENKIYIKINSEGMQKLFYYSPVNEPINVPLSEGNIGEYQIHSIGGQKYYPLIVGYEEAKIMRQEGLFSNIGDPIKNFFGKNVVIVGVMQRTGGMMDMVHLIPLSEGEWN